MSMRVRDLSRLFSPLLSSSRVSSSAAVRSADLAVIVLGGELPACTLPFARRASFLVLGDSGADSLRRIDSTLVYDAQCPHGESANLTRGAQQTDVCDGRL
jgi:hypothetical protein